MADEGFGLAIQGLQGMAQEFRAGRQMEWLDEKRKQENEDRIRKMEASKKFAESVRAKPSIWRDANAVAALAEGGYDPLGLMKMMNEQFAPPDPWNVQRAHLSKEWMKLNDEILKIDPTDTTQADRLKSLQVQASARQEQISGVNWAKDEAGNYYNALYQSLQPSAMGALNDSANIDLNKIFGREPADAIRSVEGFLDEREIATMYQRDRANLDSVGKQSLTQALKGFFTSDPETQEKIAKTQKIEITTSIDEDGDPVTKTVDLSAFPSATAIMEKSIKSRKIVDKLKKSGMIPEDFVKELQLQQSQQRMNMKGEDFDIGKVGRALGIPSEEKLSATERLKTSSSKKNRIIGGVVDVLGELPVTGAKTAYRVGKEVVGSVLAPEYERRMESARRQEEEDRKRRLSLRGY